MDFLEYLEFEAGVTGAMERPWINCNNVIIKKSQVTYVNIEFTIRYMNSLSTDARSIETHRLVPHL